MLVRFLYPVTLENAKSVHNVARKSRLVSRARLWRSFLVALVVLCCHCNQFQLQLMLRRPLELVLLLSLLLFLAVSVVLAVVLVFAVVVVVLRMFL